METEVQEIGDKGKRRPPGSVAQGRPPFPSGRWPHSPPVLSLSQTASCLCLCCRCLHSSFHCCPASGPFGKVQSICPEDSLLLFTPQPPPTLWPWPSPPRYLVLGTHLRGPLSPSMWLSSPSPCMSGTDATKSFKKSNCCSSSMHCFLEEAGEEGVQREHTYGRTENSFCVS